MIIIAKNLETIIIELILRTKNNGNELYALLKTKMPEITPRLLENFCIDKRLVDESRALWLRQGYQLYLEHPPYTEMEEQEFAENLLASILPKPEPEIKIEKEYIHKGKEVYEHSVESARKKYGEHSCRSKGFSNIRCAFVYLAASYYTNWKELLGRFWRLIQAWYPEAKKYRLNLELIEENESTTTNQSSS